MVKGQYFRKQHVNEQLDARPTHWDRISFCCSLTKINFTYSTWVIPGMSFKLEYLNEFNFVYRTVKGTKQESNRALFYEKNKLRPNSHASKSLRGVTYHKKQRRDYSICGNPRPGKKICNNRVQKHSFPLKKYQK